MIQPPKLSDLPYGTQLKAGLGVTTVIADFDFETYSPAGFIWNNQTNKFDCPHGASKKGLPTVGAAAYSEHPGAEVLCLAYDLKDGKGRRLWTPAEGCAPILEGADNFDDRPIDLFAYLNTGALIEAWNVGFEYWVWANICMPKYGFPPLPIAQLRCAAAKARASALPGSLENAGKVLNITNKKDKRGKQLLDKFSIPRNPTKTNPQYRAPLDDADPDTQALYDYCLRDIAAEAEISSLIPDLTPDELKFWQCDQAINRRGIQIDLRSVHNCIAIVEQAHAKYNAELSKITYTIDTGSTTQQVQRASECSKILKWMRPKGVQSDSLDAENIERLLKEKTLPADVRRVLEIRAMIGSAAVKKLYSMANQVTKDSRLHDLFIYHSARTGRAAGAGPQPQNLPNSGPDVDHCGYCNKYNNDLIDMFTCVWCGAPTDKTFRKEWNIDAVENALETINTASLECVEYYFGDAIATVSGCLRSLFIAAPGHDLLCSDYSAIEAVVLAALAGEEWRLEVFRTHGKIYEMSASKITGIPFEEFENHKRTTGQHHPQRKKVGKVAELASGYQGWTGAWKNFGADEFFTDEEIKEAILAWRKASPAIVEFWGGQERRWQADLYGVEGTALMAIQNPGIEFYYRGLVFKTHLDVFYIKLLSGRYLTYHKPRISPAIAPRRGVSISYEGWNSNPKYGAPGWTRIDTYGGRLVENIVQAIARDLLAFAIINLEAAGYPVVLHVHDEIVCEVREGHGSIEEFERIMSTMPNWAADWPVKASGGWRGKRYRK